MIVLRRKNILALILAHVVGHPNVHPRIHAPGRYRGPFRGPFAAVRPVCPRDPCAVRKVAGRRAEAVDARIRVP